MKKQGRKRTNRRLLMVDGLGQGIWRSGWWLRVCGGMLLVVAVDGLAGGDTVTFEDLSIAPSSYLNGDPGGLPTGQSVTDPIVSGGVSFSNTFGIDSYGGYDYPYWYGFAASNVVDSSTPYFTNQYASYPGGGYQSSNYGVAYGNGASLALPVPGKVLGFRIANTTYTYLSMANGDPYGFTAPLADSNGHFMVTASGFLQGNATGSTDFYLADLRTGSSPGILAGWAWFDLAGLGTVDTVMFSFAGSDEGLYGLNTPVYFAIDDFVYEDLVYESVPEIDPASAANVLSLLMGSLALIARRSSGRDHPRRPGKDALMEVTR
jgi:hypothetical protein